MVVFTILSIGTVLWPILWQDRTPLSLPMEHVAEPVQERSLVYDLFGPAVRLSALRLRLYLRIGWGRGRPIAAWIFARLQLRLYLFALGAKRKPQQKRHLAWLVLATRRKLCGTWLALVFVWPLVRSTRPVLAFLLHGAVLWLSPYFLPRKPRILRQRVLWRLLAVLHLPTWYARVSRPPTKKPLGIRRQKLSHHVHYLPFSNVGYLTLGKGVKVPLF